MEGSILLYVVIGVVVFLLLSFHNVPIAFSLGILSLLGKRVPLSLKVFLVAFAIVDDLGAVLVIAMFYSGDIAWSYLLLGIGLYVVLLIFNRLNVYYIPAYMIIGWIIWFRMALRIGRALR